MDVMKWRDRAVKSVLNMAKKEFDLNIKLAKQYGVDGNIDTFLQEPRKLLKLADLIEKCQFKKAQKVVLYDLDTGLRDALPVYVYDFLAENKWLNQ